MNCVESIEHATCLECGKVANPDAKHRWYCDNENCYNYVCFRCLPTFEFHMIECKQTGWTICQGCKEMDINN
jgi:hypothetical protein